MTKLKSTKENIAEALYEMINHTHGYRSDQHTKWYEDATRYIKKRTGGNITLSGNTIEIQNENGTKTLHTITIT